MNKMLIYTKSVDTLFTFILINKKKLYLNDGTLIF